jgi:hypothetical protein
VQRLDAVRWQHEQIAQTAKVAIIGSSWIDANQVWMDPVVGLLLLTRWVYARGWVKDDQECREIIDSEVVGLARL